MSRCLFLIVMSLGTMFASANNFSGKVVDENGEVVEFATVSLLNANDSTFICGTTTSADGSFSLSNNSHNAIIRITYIGFKPFFVNASGDIGTVALTPEESMLSEVAVTASRPVYKLTTEGIKTDVDGTLLSMVGTAKAVLENLPGVQKTGEGVEVFGKGAPLIYVNGRQIYNKEELDQIQSESIKSVELITNPGSKYKANVGSVILIKTKRNQGEGFSFIAQASYFQSNNTDADLGANWNYRNRGLDVFGTFWFDWDNNYEQDDITMDSKTDEDWFIKEYSHFDKRIRSLFSAVGVNYTFNDENSAGFRYYTKTMFHNAMSGTYTADVTDNGEFYDHLDNKMGDNTKWNMPHSLNVYYIGKVGKTSIDFNTDYLYHKIRKHSWNEETSLTQESRLVTSDGMVRVQFWAAKLNLSWPLWGGKFLLGGEYDNTRRDEEYVNPEHIVPSSEIDQRESIYSFFTEYTHPLPFGQMRLGLRNENDNSDYYNQGIRIDEQSRVYHHLFPSAGLSARAGKVQLMANYSRKIQRPSYRQLSGAVTYENRFSWDTGNPFLRPTIIDQASVTAMWKWMNVSLEYDHNKDVIVSTCRPVEGSEETLLFYNENVDHEDLIRAAVTFTPKFGIFQPSYSVIAIKDWIKIPSPAGYVSPKMPYIFIQLNNNFRFTPSMIAEARFLITPRGENKNFKFTKTECNVYLSLTKSFFDNRLSLQAAVHNLFNSYREYLCNYGTRTKTQLMRDDTCPKFELTLRYRFNATNSKYRGSGAGDAQKARFGNDN